MGRAVSAAPKCARCGAPAVVGLGVDREWLCLAHFDEAMRDVALVVAAIEESIAAQLGTTSRVVAVHFDDEPAP